MRAYRTLRPLSRCGPLPNEERIPAWNTLEYFRNTWNIFDDIPRIRLNNEVHACVRSGGGAVYCYGLSSARPQYTAMRSQLCAAAVYCYGSQLCAAIVYCCGLCSRSPLPLRACPSICDLTLSPPGLHIATCPPAQLLSPSLHTAVSGKTRPQRVACSAPPRPAPPRLAIDWGH